MTNADTELGAPDPDRLATHELELYDETIDMGPGDPETPMVVADRDEDTLFLIECRDGVSCERAPWFSAERYVDVRGSR